jgi:hypothetical protein
MISSKLTWQVLKRNDLTGQADPTQLNPTFNGVADRHSTGQAQTDTDIFGINKVQGSWHRANGNTQCFDSQLQSRVIMD